MLTLWLAGAAIFGVLFIGFVILVVLVTAINERLETSRDRVHRTG